MMPVPVREHVQQRVRSADRVRQVLAAAIIHASKYVDGSNIDWAEAMILADVGSIADVLESIREQKKVRRAVPGSTAGEQIHDQLAMAEVIADIKGLHCDDPQARARMIRELIEREAHLRESAAAVNRETETFEEIFAELREAGPRQREFVRKASRLRSLQMARLSDSIVEKESLERAILRLDAVYQLYLDKAVSYARG